MCSVVCKFNYMGHESQSLEGNVHLSLQNLTLQRGRGRKGSNHGQSWRGMGQGSMKSCSTLPTLSPPTINPTPRCFPGVQSYNACCYCQFILSQIWLCSCAHEDFVFTFPGCIGWIDSFWRAIGLDELADSGSALIGGCNSENVGIAPGDWGGGRGGRMTPIGTCQGWSAYRLGVKI